MPLPETFHKAMESFDTVEEDASRETPQARLLRQGLRNLMAKGEWQVTRRETEEER